MNELEAIESRRSVRVFKEEPLSDADSTRIKAAFTAPTHGPFGNSMRTTLLHPTEENPKALNGLGGSVGTYGFIKNAQAYAVGAVKPAPFALHDYGFIMEGIVLQAAQQGVGSCWLGGSFRPGPFGKAIAARDAEFVPAVIALGYPGRKRPIADKLIELHHNNANQRAAWDSLFFDQNNFETPAGAVNQPEIRPRCYERYMPPPHRAIHNPGALPKTEITASISFSREICVIPAKTS